VPRAGLDGGLLAACGANEARALPLLNAAFAGFTVPHVVFSTIIGARRAHGGGQRGGQQNEAAGRCHGDGFCVF